MMKYHVRVTAEYYRDYRIEADSEEEAEEQAIKNFNWDVNNEWDVLETKVEGE